MHGKRKKFNNWIPENWWKTRMEKSIGKFLEREISEE